MSDGKKVISINTGKPVPAGKKGKNYALNAKRLEVLIEWINDDIVELTVAGTKIDSTNIDGFISSMDNLIEKRKSVQNKQRVKKHRLKNK